MKNITLIFALFSTILLQSQDKVFNKRGEILDVKVISVTETSVTFTFPNETAIQSINRNIVTKIIYASGREQIITEAPKIELVGLEDFQTRGLKDSIWTDKNKFGDYITINPADVIGLKKVKDIEVESNRSLKTYGNERAITKSALNLLGGYAKIEDCYITLIVSVEKKYNTEIGGKKFITDVIIKGTCYRY